MYNLILASKSPYRKQLLSRLGISFDCVDSNYDESTLKLELNDPTILTQKLALNKALEVKKKYSNSIIIGSDQVCHHNNKILGKAGNIVGAKEQLLSLQGQFHELVTSYVIIHQDQIIEHTNITKLKMRNLSEDQIKNYLILDNPIDCAGSYKLELNGISLMEDIQTSDHTAIIGLPLISLANDLNKIGVQVPPISK
jgi:septum formation protein